MTTIVLPDPSLVLLIGASGAGKSTFARQHFLPTEIVSSDTCRGLVSDDENSKEASADAFALLRFIAERRLAGYRLTVLDATNVRPEDRKPLIALAKRAHMLTTAIVFDLPDEVSLERNRDRPDRDFGGHVVRNQRRALQKGLRGVKREGLRHLYTLSSEEEVNAVTVVRQRLWTDRRDDHGPFDLIGDVHGCYEELRALLDKLGYAVAEEVADDGGPRFIVTPPEGRRALFLGDLVDRGPGVVEVLRLAMDMVESGAALAVPGNHENKLRRWLQGHNVKPTHGLAESIAQIEAAPEGFKGRIAAFIDGLISHYLLDDGRLIAAHAGMRAELAGRASGAVRSFALYGETTGEVDDYGLPVRYDWASEYRGRGLVVYGHTPVLEPTWLNNTLCIDTGCVFGGALTALRYPERELVQVPAVRVHYAPARPLAPPSPAVPSPQQAADQLLDLSDVLGRQRIETRYSHAITLREGHTAAALEIMSRFAVDPRWLIYLPPTMSPPETSQEDGTLEHPAQALSYFRNQGIAQVICEEKHMGSRAVLIVCRDEEAAVRRFGVAPGAGLGAITTRTGRPFFSDDALLAALLARVRDALTAAGLWEELDTDWVCLDAELMPWSLKAVELIRAQYASVGAAARSSLADVTDALALAAGRGVPTDDLLALTRQRAALTDRYDQAWRRYCWPVASLDDLRLAPFHLLAAEGLTFFDRDHTWHMDTLHRLRGVDPVLFHPTRHLTVDLHDPDSCAQAIAWWEDLTGAGGEGMVVKPSTFLARGKKGLVQPALKCRGREYLRIIYGPEYTLPHHLDRLRKRGTSTRRAQALREFALGLEALDRFVERQPLRHVHACVFGVLALESEPTDPRL